MGGDFRDHQRAVGGRRTARPSQPTLYLRWALGGCLVLLLVVIAILLTPRISAPTMTSVVERQKPAEPDPELLSVANKSKSTKDVKQGGTKNAPSADEAKSKSNTVPPSDVQTPKPDAGAPPNDQKAGSNTGVTPPETKEAKPDTELSPSGVQTSQPELKPIVGPSDRPKSGADMAAPAPEDKSKPNVATPPAAEATKPDAVRATGQPDAQRPGLGTAASPTEAKSNPDMGTPSSDTPSKPDEEVAGRPPTKTPPTSVTAPPSDPNVRGPGRKPVDHGDDHLVVPQLVLAPDVAKKVGERVWQNETGGSRDAITSWNVSETFASLGIGHFLWFPAGKTAPYEESFPELLGFLRDQNVKLPAWLDKKPIPPCPWPDRADFQKKFNSPEMKQLRQFLLDTVQEQTQFLVARARGAMDKILEETPERTDRDHILTQFSRVVQASKDLYPLIDYINFKGEGTKPEETVLDKETGKRQGWGLKQVLLKMNGTTSDRNAVLAEFAESARSVLERRVHNDPATHVNLAGWSNRVATYRRPIVEVAANSKPTQDEKPAREEKPAPDKASKKKSKRWPAERVT